MSERAAADETVTLVARHHLVAGEEAEFRQRMKRMMNVESKFPGYRGVEMIPPIPGVQEDWVTLIRFDNAAHMQAWVNSPERSDLLRSLGHSVETLHVEQVGSSFGSWFARTGEAPASPDWKQAMTVLLMLYPTVMLITLLLGPRLTAAGISMSTGMFIGNVVSVAALTWLLMPLANRVLRAWLAPRASTRATVLGTLVVLALYAAMLVGFALLT